MKLLVKFIIILFYPTTILANITNEIIKKLDETNNITFEFEQISSNKNEKGKCLLAFPGKLKCIYNSDDGKEILVTNNSLYIIKHKFERSYRYPIKNSAFNIILNKKKILENLKMVDTNYIKETNNKYFYEIQASEGIYVKIFFGKKNKILKGWETISYNQEPVIFNILNPVINSELKEKFILPNYSN
tara:strand:- start:216 stop:779 length:564 start_codon:yes stop_codon:yes gene_type:complete